MHLSSSAAWQAVARPDLPHLTRSLVAIDPKFLQLSLSLYRSLQHAQKTLSQVNGQFANCNFQVQRNMSFDSNLSQILTVTFRWRCVGFSQFCYEY